MKHETTTTANRPILRPGVYIRCRTCGRYLQLQAAVEKRYCSAACAEAFSACPTCGRYFPGGEGYRGTHCSRECAVPYTLTRTFGLEPALVVAEEMV